MPFAVLLSEYNEVPFEGWAWSIFIAVMRIGMQRWPPMKIPPVSGSAAETMAFLMVLNMTWNTHEFS